MFAWVDDDGDILVCDSIPPSHEGMVYQLPDDDPAKLPEPVTRSADLDASVGE